MELEGDPGGEPRPSRGGGHRGTRGRHEDTEGVEGGARGTRQKREGPASRPRGSRGGETPFIGGHVTKRTLAEWGMRGVKGADWMHHC